MGDFTGVSIWTGLEDEGGVRVGELRDIVAFTDRWSIEDGWSCTIEIGTADGQRAQIVRGRVIQIESENEATREYRIASHADGRSGGPDTIIIQGQDPLLDLAEKVLLYEVGSGGVIALDGGAVDLTPQEYLDTYAMPQAQLFGIAVDTGTVEPDLPLTLDWNAASVLALIRQVVSALRDRGLTAEVDYRRDIGTGYLLDILTEIGSAATAPELHVGRHIERWGRLSSRADQASVVVPLGGVDGTGGQATIARAAWQVTAINGGTNTLTVVDPLGGPGPVQLSGQATSIAGSWYVQVPSTGALLEVLSATRVSALETDVELADVSDFAVDDVFEFRSTSSGTLMFLLVDPAALTALGSKLVPIVQDNGRGERNLLANPWARDWSGGSAYPTPSTPPTGWKNIPGATIFQDTDPLHARFSPNAIRVYASAYGGTIAAGIYSPLAQIYPVAGADLFSVTVSLEFITITNDIRITIIDSTDALIHTSVIPMTSLPAAGVHWDVSIAGIDLSAAVGGVRVGVTGANVTNPGNGANVEFYLAAVQLTQTPSPADAYTEYSRANALWQYGNAYLAEFGDPPPDFEVSLVDLARIDPAGWAHVAIERGATARLIDDARGLDWDVRVIERTRNRLVPGDTRFTFSARSSSLAALSAGIGPGGSVIAPNTSPPVINPPPVPVPAPPDTPPPLVYSIYAGGLLADLSLSAFPSAATERTPSTRAKLYLGNSAYVRLSARVITALAGAKIRAVYSTTGFGDAETWDALDGASGPELPLDETGDIVGTDVAIALAARADVFVAFLEESGDDATTVEIGNAILHAFSGQLPITPVGCGLSGFTVQGDDFDGGNPPEPAYADTSEFMTWVATARQDYAGYADGPPAIDTAVRFNGRNSLRIDYNDATYPFHWATVFTDDGDPTETSDPQGDRWYRLCIAFQNGFEVVTDGTPGGGLSLMGVGFFTPVPAYVYFALIIRDGRLRLFVSSSSPSDETDIGDASLVIGQGFCDVIARTVISGSTVALRVWVGRACDADIPRLAEVVYDFGSGTPAEKPPGVIAWMFPSGLIPDAITKSAWISKWEQVPASVDSNPFGVGNP